MKKDRTGSLLFQMPLMHNGYIVAFDDILVYRLVQFLS